MVVFDNTTRDLQLMDPCGASAESALLFLHSARVTGLPFNSKPAPPPILQQVGIRTDQSSHTAAFALAASSSFFLSSPFCSSRRFRSFSRMALS